MQEALPERASRRSRGRGDWMKSCSNSRVSSSSPASIAAQCARASSTVGIVSIVDASRSAAQEPGGWFQARFASGAQHCRPPRIELAAWAANTNAPL